MFRIFFIVIFLGCLYIGYHYMSHYIKETNTNVDNMYTTRSIEDICQHKAQIEATVYYTEIEPDSEKANEIYQEVYEKCIFNEDSNLNNKGHY